MKFNTINLDEQIGFQLKLAELAVFSEIIERLKIIDLRPVDLSVLILVNNNENIRQYAIGDYLKMQRPNVVALIDGLEARKLLVRSIDETDRRANILKLTARGNEVLQQALEMQEQHRKVLNSALAGIDIEQFMEALKRLSKIKPPSRK